MSTPMTPAQAAQQSNRTGGGQYKEKAYSEAQVDLGGGEAQRSPAEVFDELARAATAAGDLKAAKGHLRAGNEAAALADDPAPARYEMLREIDQGAARWKEGVRSFEAMHIYQDAREQISERIVADERAGGFEHLQDYADHLRAKEAELEETDDISRQEEQEAYCGVADILETRLEDERQEAAQRPAQASASSAAIAKDIDVETSRASELYGEHLEPVREAAARYAAEAMDENDEVRTEEVDAAIARASVEQLGYNPMAQVYLTHTRALGSVSDTQMSLVQQELRRAAGAATPPRPRADTELSSLELLKAQREASAQIERSTDPTARAAHRERLTSLRAERQRRDDAISPAVNLARARHQQAVNARRAPSPADRAALVAADEAVLADAGLQGASAASESVQSGQLHDVVASHGRIFRRSGPSVPIAPRAIRVQSDRPIEDAQMATMTQMADYAAQRAASHPEPVGTARRESPYSFVMEVDTSASHLAEHLMDRFEPQMREYVADGGTPVRKSDGQRLVSGLGDGRQIEFFYDEATD